MRRLAPIGFAVAVGLGGGVARADVTSWLAFGTGLAVDHATDTGLTNVNAAFSASIGVGSDPTHKWVIGGIFRTMSRFTEGTDIGIAARLTTGGFARGDWGFGFDLGPSLRLWGSNAYGTYPLQGAVLLGAPWGLQVTVGADIVNLEGTPTSLGGYALVEFDLLRFTVMRQGSTEKYWKNPLPVGGHADPNGPPSPPP